MGERGGWIGFAAIVVPALFVAPAASAQSASPEVIVHLNAKPDVTLERRDGDDWVEVCFAPCDLRFPTRAQYRVGGGIRDSDPFRLRESSPGLAIVDVERRSRGEHALGAAFIGVGSALGFVGLVVAGIGSSVSNCSDRSTRDTCSGGELVAPGLVAALVGVGVIVLGIDLVVVNRASSANVERRAADTRTVVDRVSATSFDLARRRESTWVAPSTGLAFPIVDVRF